MTTPNAADLLDRAQTEGNPVIDGSTATFVWQGETAPELIGDFNQWGNSQAGSAQLTQSAPGIWTYTLDLPADAYVEYVFTTDPDEDDERVLDPLNRNQIPNGLGYSNNYFTMPTRQPSIFIDFMSNTPQGEITRHAIYHPALVGDDRRDVWLYHPPTDQPVPLLVVFDGRDYLRRANITQIVANLIAVNRIQPVALALIHNAGIGRYHEYNATDTVLAQLTELVLPLAYNNLNLLDHDQHPGTWGVMGASMGGQQALYTGLRLPHIFGKVISQAGAFQMSLTDHPSITEAMVRDFPKRDLSIWMDCGTMDWLLPENREMAELMNGRGYDLTYKEHSASHNYTAWRDMLPEALTTVFPPKG